MSVLTNRFFDHFFRRYFVKDTVKVIVRDDVINSDLTTDAPTTAFTAYTVSESFEKFLFRMEAEPVGGGEET
ncbi:MAG: hypothetical protein K5911_04475 [Eubacteriales bacterium]|nr:hypothetical protein [Eubacteriales bacterium]